MYSVALLQGKSTSYVHRYIQCTTYLFIHKMKLSIKATVIGHFHVSNTNKTAKLYTAVTQSLLHNLTEECYSYMNIHFIMLNGR